VAIRVRVPATASAGQELEYRICVENLSQAAAHHVIVRNPLPANTRFVRANPEPSSKDPELIWELGTLQGCACREIVLALAPTAPGDVKNCARVQFEHGQCVTTRIARPAISLRKNGPTQAFVNETLRFQLIVTNTGATELTGVTLTDTLPPELEYAGGQKQLTWDLGTLAPGQSRSVDYEVVAKIAGRLCNKAVATAAGGLREEADGCVNVVEARLTLAMTGPKDGFINQPTPYQITVRNAGTTALANVAITNPVPAAMSYVSASAGGQFLPPGQGGGGGTVQWLIGALEPGAGRTVDIVLRSSSAGQVCNRATAAAGGAGTVQAEACTTFAGVAGLFLDIKDDPDPVEVGATTRYTLTVRNQGTQMATNVRIEAQVPDQFVVTEVRRLGGDSDHRQDGQKVVFREFNIPPRGEVQFVIEVKALQAGDVRFKVDMFADQLTSGKAHKEESTTIFGPSSSRAPSPPGDLQRR
jgi:uncharacterized repeat protein (TIGR01451 family)